MPRLVGALLILMFGGRVQAQTATPPPTVPAYRASWWDAVSVSGGGALYLLPGALGMPRGAPSCAPCNPATLPGIDRWAVHSPVSLPNTGSTVLLLGVAGWTALAGLGGLPVAEWRGNVAMFANAASWTAASTSWIKVLVRRKRPVLYTSGALAAAGNPDAQEGFPSEHAALAFAAATSYLVMSAREHLAHRTRNALLLYGGAVAVSVLRVAAGQHLPTDVVAGAVLGSGIGWLVPTVHPKVP
jgi:membrane-associated phospholipid phosphatase